MKRTTQIRVYIEDKEKLDNMFRSTYSMPEKIHMLLSYSDKDNKVKHIINLCKGLEKDFYWDMALEEFKREYP